MDSKNPLKSIILMPYISEIDSLKDLKDLFVNKEGHLINYSRYWHGQAMYSKLMMLIMPLGYTMYFMQLASLIILFILVIKKLFKHNKLLSIGYAFMCLCINLFFTAFSVEYYFVSLLMLIFTYVVINLVEKMSRNIGLMFAISGALTCFFDFLTCETLVLTVPLFIYIFLCIDKNKKQLFKEIIKFIFIWGMFYCLTFFSKWIIAILYMGFDYIFVILNQALLRVADKGLSFPVRFAKSVLLVFKDLLPFAFFESGMIFVIILLLFSIHILIFDNKKYSLLLIPVVIPFIRFFVISTHSYYFHYFAYRAIGVVILFIVMMLLLKFKSFLVKKYN